MDTQREIELLRDRIDEGERVIADNATFAEWNAKTRLTLVRIFGGDHNLVEQFDGLSFSLSMWTDRTPRHAWRQARDTDIKTAVSMLEAAIFEREHLAVEPDDSDNVDPELWYHVGHLVEKREWSQLASASATFVESKVREWSGLSEDDVGKNLMVKVFKGDGGKFPCGRTSGEELGWQQLATGFVQALGNVDRHRIQTRDDARIYAMGVLGTASLLLTQLRYQHGNRFRGPAYLSGED